MLVASAGKGRRRRPARSNATELTRLAVRPCERPDGQTAVDARARDRVPGWIFLRFLKFGALAWGGPAAQIAMIKQECVDEEGWVDEETLKKTLAVYQVLPGPEAHELCVFFGRTGGGRLGGFMAGLGFMLPGFLLMLAFSALYVEANLEGTSTRSSTGSRRPSGRSSPGR